MATRCNCAIDRRPGAGFRPARPTTRRALPALGPARTPGGAVLLSRRTTPRAARSRTSSSPRLQPTFRSARRDGRRHLPRHRRKALQVPRQVPPAASRLPPIPSSEAIEAYGVWGPKKTFGREYMGVVRTTFLDRRRRHGSPAIWPVTRIKGHAPKCSTRPERWCAHARLTISVTADFAWPNSFVNLNVPSSLSDVVRRPECDRVRTTAALPSPSAGRQSQPSRARTARHQPGPVLRPLRRAVRHQRARRVVGFLMSPDIARSAERPERSGRLRPMRTASPSCASRSTGCIRATTRRPATSTCSCRNWPSSRKC